MAIDFRLGRYQDVLGDVAADALICDPPYSARTHAAYNDSGIVADSGCGTIDYAAWGEADVMSFVGFWRERVRGWWVVFSDHTLIPAWHAALEGVGLYVFAPLPHVTLNGALRLAGDGPASWTTWVTVARPRREPWCRWGMLPGAYVAATRNTDGLVTGAKQHHVMQAIVRDYSREGDLIVDPCAGGATTLIAAASLGRRAVGAELDADTYERASARVRRGTTLAFPFAR